MCLVPIVVVVRVSLQPEIIRLCLFVALIVLILFLLPLVSLPLFPLRVLTLLIQALLVLLRIDLNFHFAPPEC